MRPWEDEARDNDVDDDGVEGDIAGGPAVMYFGISGDAESEGCGALLEEGTLFVLILTQTLSLVYLDIDTQATSAGERVDHGKEVTVTIFLAILNSCALIVLTLALIVSALREYGPKVGRKIKS